MSIKNFIEKLPEDIKNKDVLVENLIKLDEMIGMKKAKEAVVDQLKFLITSPKQDKHMLHCVISGPPGVGKTQLAIVLAKIWNSLKLINKRMVPLDNDNDSKEELAQENKDLRDSLNYIAMKSTEQRMKIRNLRNTCRNFKTNTTYNTFKKLISIPLLNIHSLNTDIMTEWHEYTNETDENDVIKITSREDYVAKYVGHTSLKTLKLLNKNLGKVVFIDEAYSLINGDRDSFGNDALTTINRFMSEHCDEIIIIFAGYKDKLEEIYSAQPGLKRRFTWTFDIDGYDDEELSQIFKQQMERVEWKFDKNIKLKEFFNKNKDLFKHYGGDTEKLCFYVKLAYANEKFENNEIPEKVVNKKILENGFEKYKNNINERVINNNPPEHMYL